METAAEKIKSNGIVGFIAKEIAQKDVSKWLDFQEISESNRTKHQASIDRIVEAVELGNVIINDDNTITQKLKHPLGEAKVSAINFAASLTVGEINTQMNKATEDNAMSVPISYICAATGELKGVIVKMNNKDYKVSDSIILFFML